MLTNPGTVLLIEDSEDDILMIRHAFEQGGIANPLAVVRDGEEAIAFFKGERKYAHRDSYPLPVLVLLDLGLPRTDGFEVLRWLRQQAAFIRLPVVVLTGSLSMKDASLAYQLGANSFLVKPADFQDILQMTQTLSIHWLAMSQSPEIPSSPSEPPPSQL